MFSSGRLAFNTVLNAEVGLQPVFISFLVSFSFACLFGAYQGCCCVKGSANG